MMAEWHPIRVVARRTGLSPHVIRAWEKRYGAVTPTRTATNRRVYSTADVERLLLLRRATLSGRSIGQIAGLTTEALKELLAEDEAAQKHAQSVVPTPEGTARPRRGAGRELLTASLEAIAELDGVKLQTQLDRASLELSRPTMMEQLIVPLMQELGDRWQDGSLRVNQEHLATAIVRSFVGNMNGAFNTPPSAPEIIITTPAGQLHEIGALLASATAALDGWRTTYLGPSLPAEEIAAAVRLKTASAVALSIIYPTDDAHLASELQRLRQLLPDTPILVGGRGADGYTEVLEQIGARHLRDYQSLRPELEAARG